MQLISLWILALIPLVGQDSKKLAIQDFTVIGWTGQGPRGYKITDPREIEKAKNELSQSLMASLENELQVEFDIVERRKLEAIQKDNKLAKSGQLYAQASSKTWKLLGVDRLLTGTISFVQEVRSYQNEKLKLQTKTTLFHLVVSFKLIESQTGRILAVGEAVARTDSRKLRNDGFGDETYLSPMCSDVSKDIRLRLNKALKTIRDSER